MVFGLLRQIFAESRRQRGAVYLVWGLRSHIILTLAYCVTAAGSDMSMGALSCVQEFDVPGYSGVIWHSGIAGKATATIRLSPTGTVADVIVNSPFAVLSRFLTVQVKKAGFREGCGGRTITIEFVYQLLGPPQETPENSVRLQAPGTFIITAHPRKSSM